MSNKEEQAQEKAPRELKPEVTRIASVLKDEFKLDKDTGNIEQTSEDSLYEKALPEDLTMSTVKKVHGFDRCFVAALTQVVGEKSLQAFQDNKGLQQTNFKVAMDGRSSVVGKIDRKKDYKDGFSGDGNGDAATVTKYCNLSVKVKTSLGQDFNLVKRDLLERGKTALAD